MCVTFAPYFKSNIDVNMYVSYEMFFIWFLHCLTHFSTSTHYVIVY